MMEGSSIRWVLSGASVLLLALLVVGGCGTWNRPAPDEAVAQRVPPFPAATPVGPPIDVVAVRDGEAVTLVNRTPRRYGPVDVWLNEQYVRRVDAIEIGVNDPLPLDSFVNKYGEAYPVGSFLRPERSAKLVLAELHDGSANVRHKLIVQPPGTR